MAFAGMMMTIMGQPIVTPPVSSNSWTLNNPIFNNDGTDIYEFTVGGSTDPQGVSFSTTGDVFLTVDGTSDTIKEFNMTTNFDLGTANVTNTGTLTSTTPRGMFIADNGTDVYYVSYRAADRLTRDTLGSAWDVTTVTAQTFVNIAGLSGNLNNAPNGLSITASNAYVVQDSYIYEYDLSASFPDVDLATYTGRTDLSSLLPGTPDLQGIVIKSDGTKIFTLDVNSNVSELSLSTPYDSSTVSHIQTVAMSNGVLGASAPTSNVFECIYIDRNNGDYLFIGNTAAGDRKLFKIDISV